MPRRQSAANTSCGGPPAPPSERPPIVLRLTTLRKNEDSDLLFMRTDRRPGRERPHRTPAAATDLRPTGAARQRRVRRDPQPGTVGARPCAALPACPCPQLRGPCPCA